MLTSTAPNFFIGLSADLTKIDKLDRKIKEKFSTKLETQYSKDMQVVLTEFSKLQQELTADSIIK